MHLCFALPLIVILQAAAPPARYAAVPFTLREGVDIVVPVHLSGQGPFRFLLDTGSSRSAVTASLARRLRLSPGGRTLVLTPQGGSWRSTARLALALGPIHAGLDAVILPDAQLGGGVDGIVGADVLAVRRFTIDYAARRITFEGRPPNRTPGASLPLTARETGFVVDAALDRSGPTLRLIPDSGTAVLVLFDGKDRPLPRAQPAGYRAFRAGPRVAIERAVLIENARIGSIGLQDQIAIVMTATAVASTADGLLPLHLFAQVEFDAPGGRLTLFGAR